MAIEFLLCTILGSMNSCAAIEELCRYVRAEAKLMDFEVVFALHQIPVARRVNAIDPARLDSVAV
jgi:hypothetical protein